jgi:hypothetical protein
MISGLSEDKATMTRKMYLIAVTWSIAVSVLAQTDPPSKADGAPKREILATAQAFWIAVTLNDMDDLRRVVLETGTLSFQAPRDDAEMSKLKSLPQVKSLRDKVEKAIKDAFVFDDPQIATDGKSATTNMKLHVNNLAVYCELRMLYDAYISQANDALKTGDHLPSPETVKKAVLAHNKTKIKEMVSELQKTQLSTLYLERTPRGWRVDFVKFMIPTRRP